MPHINYRYKLIQDKIDINYEIKSEWLEMISTALDKRSNVSYLLYVNRTEDDSKFKLMNIREADSAVVDVFRHMVIQFDKSLFRDLALDTIGV